MKRLELVRIPLGSGMLGGMRRTAYAVVAGAMTGVSGWLWCAAFGLHVANPVFSFGMLGLTMAGLFRLASRQEGDS